MTSDALVEVDPGSGALPEVSSVPSAGSVVGRVVTAQPYLSAPGDTSRTIDLSEGGPVLLEGFWDLGGRILDGGGGLGWQARALGEPARVAWVEQWLGWTYTGHALWLIGDAVEFAAVAEAVPGYFCSHEPSGAYAIALVDPMDCDFCPVVSAEAWRIDPGTWTFDPVPPGEVSCYCECGG
ncbi:MAG: hypothetical protein ABIJ48_11895 [Actinomycetota bacterium]